jgi:ATP-dependent Clp protease protease subunit
MFPTSNEEAGMPGALEISNEGLKEKLLRQRRVLIGGRIESKTMRLVVEVLLQLDAASDDVITLIISSDGGDAEVSSSFMDLITALNSPVDGLVLDVAGSGGANILQACRKRMMLPHSRIFCHFARHTWTMRPDLGLALNRKAYEWMEREVAEEWEETKKLYHRVDKEFLDTIFKVGEEYGINIYPRQALEIGLIDEIVTDFKLFAPKPSLEEKD